MITLRDSLSRIVQHEMEHLDGKTFLDRMGRTERESAERQARGFAAAIKKDVVRVAQR